MTNKSGHTHDKLESDKVRAAFHSEARRRLVAMKLAGTGIPAAAAFDYLIERALGGRPGRPGVVKADGPR